MMSIAELSVFFKNDFPQAEFVIESVDPYDAAKHLIQQVNDVLTYKEYVNDLDADRQRA